MSIFCYKKTIHFPSQGQETKPKYQEMMSALDENKNDKIDFEDFMVHVVSLTLMSDLRQEIQNVQKSKWLRMSNKQTGLGKGEVGFLK